MPEEMQGGRSGGLPGAVALRCCDLWSPAASVGHEGTVLMDADHLRQSGGPLPLTATSTVPSCSMPTANVFSGYVFCS